MTNADKPKRPGTFGLTLIQTMLVVAISALVLSIAVNIFTRDWSEEPTAADAGAGVEQSER